MDQNLRKKNIITSVPKHVVIGSQMSEDVIKSFVGDCVMGQMTSDTTDAMRQICILRGYHKLSEARLLEFFVIAKEMEKLLDLKSFFFKKIDKSLTGNWRPEVAVLLEDFTACRVAVESRYQAGGNDVSSSASYVGNLSLELGDRFFKVEQI